LSKLAFGSHLRRAAVDILNDNFGQNRSARRDVPVGSKLLD